ADTSARGQIDLALPAAGLRLDAKLDLAVEDFRANTLSPGEELLRWASLQLRGLQLRAAPGQPLGVEVAETVLSDYFARIAIDPNGRINLQDLIKHGTDPAAPAPPAGAPATPATAANAANAPNAPSAPSAPNAPSAPSAPNAVPPAASAAAPAKPGPQI